MATIPEIAIAMERLTNCMPPPRGVKPKDAFDGYVAALSSFLADDINEAISRYLSGAFPQISAKFYPRAPELASCVRAVVAERSDAVDKVRRKHELDAEREEAARIEEVFRNRTDEERQRVAAAYEKYLVETDRQQCAERNLQRETAAKERERIRAEYGLTPDALAAVPDRKLPKGMAQAGEELGSLFEANL